MASDVRPSKKLRTSEEVFENYDVFISHRGPDTKTGFVGFLYDGLEYAGLRPFLDCVSIDKGQDSWACIEHAIKTTPIVVVIFSVNYAQSKWCLRELHVILKTRGVKILPVFYKIEPWELRFLEKGRLASGYAKLKETHDATFVKEWKEVLERVSKLNGWEYKEGDKRLEKELVKGIVGRIFEWANKPLPLDVGDHVIRVDMVAQEIIQRLDKGKNVLVLGLWGMGGIGKSTLAKELYNRLRTRFGASCFVEDVTDKVMQGGVAKVQSHILKDLCKIESDGIKDKSRGKVVLEERLSKKKILVVLDDVCEKVGMEHLISRRMLSCEGSMCIITSRNKRLLQTTKSFDVTSEVYVHDVRRLDYEDSRRVFTSFAHGSGFKVDQKLEELVSCITKRCGGIPLVLKVCGALLKDEEDMDIWKDVLKRLECGSIVDEEMIFECLMISYDALQAQQKEMFLDIACALLGESKDMAIEVWRSEGRCAALGVRSLVERALVIVDEGGCFSMHDHVRDMGRRIVKREEAREGVVRRLWEPESSRLLRSNEIVPKFLETLVINTTFNDEVDNSPIGLDLSSSTMLRIMICWSNSMPKLSLPKDLKWFSWRQYFRPLVACSLPIPGTSELVILDLNWCNYDALGESIGNASKLARLNLSWSVGLGLLPNSFGALRSLRTLNLSHSAIEGLPESFGSLSLLETLVMDYCSNLRKLPDSFGALGSLRTLNFFGCAIEGLPEFFGSLSSLEILNLFKCSSLKKLPDSFHALGTLRTLNLSHSTIESLPESFGTLNSLETLDMDYCSNLKKLPDSFGALGTLRTLNLSHSTIEGLPESFGSLSSLESLIMYGCSNLKILPDSFGALESLRTLGLSQCAIEGLPESFESLRSLESLYLNNCSNLMNLPDSFGLLGTLKTLSLGASRIEGLPESFGSLRSLESLYLNNCSNLMKLLDSFGLLETLKTLSLGASRIEGLPKSFGSLRLLESLYLSNCSNLMKLPDSFGALETLRTLSLRASRIEGLPESFGSLRLLESLYLSNCSNLMKLPDSFGALETLRTLSLRASRIEGLPESFGSLSSLQRLDVNGCLYLKKLPNSFGGLKNLRFLDLEASGIEGLPDSFACLSSLEILDLSGCQNLTRLPDAFWNLKALIKVSLDCSGVEKWPMSCEKVCSSEELNFYYMNWCAKIDSV